MKDQINTIHLKAPGDWINDPNGFIYYGGKYHLFYQYFPYAPFWGTMHWGHAVSTDLVTWEHVGIALFPSKVYDRNGVFSGSAIEIDGKMYIYYTASIYEGQDSENIHIQTGYNGEQSQAMILSQDGFTFDNFNDKQKIIPVITDTNIADPHDCRDPKVWKMANTYYMCLASTHLKEKGVLLIYKSDDAVHWNYLNRLESDQFGFMLECPDLFEINGKWILINCPLGISEKGAGYPHHAMLCMVDFEPESGEVRILGDNRYLDYGYDLYASQTNLDEEGRRVLLAWVRMKTPMLPHSNSASNGRMWNGMMTIPRVIEERDGVIYTLPHPNIRKYFMGLSCSTLSTGKLTMRNDGMNYQITTTLSEGEWIEIERYRIGLENGRVVGDRTALVPESVAIHRRSETPYVGRECKLEIYMDPDIIEVFVDDGKYVITHVTYRNVAK